MIVEARNDDVRASDFLFNGEHLLGRREPRLTHAFPVVKRKRHRDVPERHEVAADVPPPGVHGLVHGEIHEVNELAARLRHERCVHEIGRVDFDPWTLVQRPTHRVCEHASEIGKTIPVKQQFHLVTEYTTRPWPRCTTDHDRDIGRFLDGAVFGDADGGAGMGDHGRYQRQRNDAVCVRVELDQRAFVRNEIRVADVRQQRVPSVLDFRVR